MDRNAQLTREFDADELELRLRQSKVACVLGMTLIPAGVALDVISYPDQLLSLALIRIAAAALIGMIYALHFSDRLKPHVGLLTMAGLIVAVGSMAAMVALTDGALSNYYLGIFLILFAVGVLAPMKTQEAALFCVITLLIYIFSCSTSQDPASLIPQLLSKLYFLILTSIISVTAAHLNFRRRFNEFSLKYRLAAQHKQLSALDRLKSQFFANVSHELRTPLTLILAPLEKIKTESAALSGGARDLLSVVENNAFRLLRLVNDILSLIKIEEGSDHLVMKAFDLSSFLRGIHASMKNLAELKSITLSLDDADGQLFIVADPEAMDKIVTNILTNAIKFTPEGGRISLTAERVGTEIALTISDSGIGIPPEKLPHIFDRFYQVDGSTTRKHQGLGLGLAMVRELVDRHKGSVTVTSSVGEGSTFSLRFGQLSEDRADLGFADTRHTIEAPLEPMQALHAKAQQSLLQGLETPLSNLPAPISTDAHRARLLIVDDEPDMRRYLSTMLSDEYSLIEAVDGHDALEKANSTHPDVMLLDVMLPGVSGLDVCKVLKDKAETRHIKIIVLTARADEEAKLIALRHGADDFLIKPFSGIEVRTRLANLEKAAALERDLQASNADLKQSLKQLKDTEAALVQNARLSALGTMAAGLLHEIGNPLNFMGTALQLAGRSAAVKNNIDTLETFQDIQAGYDRIRRIVGDLRGFTAPQRPENAKPFDLNDAIEHALRFTAHMRRGVIITKTSDGPAVVSGSLSSISQVLVNLIINAFAAVRSVEELRQPELKISLEIKAGQAIIRVRDNGTGIDPAIQDRIFDPFFSTKDAGEGMGLGLAVSHRIVSNHLGLLAVKSTPGEWTEFSFNLPLTATLAATEEHHAAA
jgi:signal transduction histidine kinase